MTYRLIWAPQAEQQLASVWSLAADKAAVVAANARFEREVVLDPLEIGESQRSNTRRVAFDSPVGFYYDVLPEEQIVIVQAVFATGR